MIDFGKRYGSNGKQKGAKSWLTPASEYQTRLINETLKRASYELRFSYGINVSFSDYKLYTAAVYYVYAAFQYLSVKYESLGAYGVTLGGLFDIDLSVREVEDAEKTGNIDPVITLGPVGQDIVRNIRDYIVEKYYPKPMMTTFSDEEAEDYKYIVAYAIKHLTTYDDMHFDINDMVLYTCTMVFLKHAIITAVDYGVTSESHSCTLEIARLFTINSNNIKVGCVPGEDGKLKSKSDGMTEIEYED